MVGETVSRQNRWKRKNVFVPSKVQYLTWLSHNNSIRLLFLSQMTKFHFDHGHHKLMDGNAAEDLMMSRFRLKEDEARNTTAFSDWSFYQELKNQPGCQKVELSRVHVEHSSWFLTGLQAVYRSSFADGREDVETEAPMHKFQRFRYRQYGQSTRSTLELGEKEYITNCTFRRVDKISDRVTFQTNLRTASFGSPAFSGFLRNWLLPFSGNKPVYALHKIVAFAGVTSEMVEDIGVFSESQNWMRVKEFVLVRDLVSQDRAVPVQDPDGDSILQTLVLDTNQDIFRRVLTHLLPTNNNR